MSADESGYINYFEVLGVSEDAKPGEVRNRYKRAAKDLILEISRTTLTEDRRDRFLLEMAKLNAAYYILRDSERRQRYMEDRERVIALEEQWRTAAEQHRDDEDVLRRAFDNALRHFLSRYLEELLLEAGRDAECVEASGWDAAHERHASRVLRHYRQQLYQIIHERLPFYDVTQPQVDWMLRSRFVDEVLSAS